MRIPVYQPDLRGKEREYVLDCLESGWISSRGRYVDLFEEAFSSWVGDANVTSVANGTVALHLILSALGIGAGDEVIVPTFTYVASVNAMTYVGATPVFVDCERETWQASASEIEKKIGPRTKAIMVVHLYGHPVDMDAIMELARRHNLLVVEDAAEAFGTLYKGRHVGTFGDAASFSFFGNKTITTGEGGIVLARDANLMAEMRLLKSQYASPVTRYWHEKVGFNYRMTNIQAAIGLAQIERAPAFVDAKRRIAHAYADALRGTSYELHAEAKDTLHSYWMVSVLVPSDVNRDHVAQLLESEGIETRPTFYPVHTMPMYKDLPTSRDAFPVSDELSRRGLNLPSWPGLSHQEIEAVTTMLRRALDLAV